MRAGGAAQQLRIRTWQRPESGSQHPGLVTHNYLKLWLWEALYPLLASRGTALMYAHPHINICKSKIYFFK